MEYQMFAQNNPFQSRFEPDFPETYSTNDRYPFIPVEVRLQENKERRLQIERDRQVEKQIILEKRREKEENVQRALKKKLQAKENAKFLFSNMNKTYGNKFEGPCWVKAEEIEDKIKQCRNRADQYRTLYKRKLRDNLENREHSVRERKRVIDKQDKDRSIQFHMNQWKEYEKKIVDKYKGAQINYNRLYDGFIKKQEGLKQIMEQYKHKDVQNQPIITKTTTVFKKPLQKITAKKKGAGENDQPLPNNPVYSHPEVSSFGLSKSISNPQKILREMKQFLQLNMMIEQPSTDSNLILKFELYLQQGSKFS